MAEFEPAFTLDERDEIGRAFSAGNYANAYESTDLADHHVDEMPAHEHAAYVAEGGK